ncbi:MAG: purine-nucleoside phosphorylase [Ruminococcaceae bacterium]|nr:purine-nucleoside phosphorylase [Oscillospiraceae bacterium]
MSEVYKKLLRCKDTVRSKTDFTPDIAVVLGSGLGGFADKLDTVDSIIPYSEIEGFPVSTVQGHSGRFVMGTLGGAKIICMQGRVHFYEGYPLSDVVMPIRLMRLLGAKTLILTNASGGVDPNISAGSLMMITDHISLFVPNPLAGANIDELGTRFPDMSEVYDKNLREVIRKVADENEIPLCEGVYAQASGPCFETPIEVRLLGAMGASAVGMSTAVEAIAAVHCGYKVCGISCVCNKGAGLSPTPLSHEEVQEAAAMASPRFMRLLRETIIKISRENN